MALLNALSKQIFRKKIKISSTVLPISLSEHLQILKKMCFICNDKGISENNPYNQDGIARCKINCAEEHLTEWSKRYKSSESNRFYEDPRKFNIICNR